MGSCMLSTDLLLLNIQIVETSVKESFNLNENQDNNRDIRTVFFST